MMQVNTKSPNAQSPLQREQSRARFNIARLSMKLAAAQLKSDERLASAIERMIRALSRQLSMTA